MKIIAKYLVLESRTMMGDIHHDVFVVTELETGILIWKRDKVLERESFEEMKNNFIEHIINK